MAKKKIPKIHRIVAFILERNKTDEILNMLTNQELLDTEQVIRQDERKIILEAVGKIYRGEDIYE